MATCAESKPSKIGARMAMPRASAARPTKNGTSADPADSEQECSAAFLASSIFATHKRQRRKCRIGRSSSMRVGESSLTLR